MVFNTKYMLIYYEYFSFKKVVKIERFNAPIFTHLCPQNTCNYLKNKGKASLIARKATQPPMVSMIAFLTSWSPFCILK